MNEIIQIGNFLPSKTRENKGRVYDIEGISPCLCSAMGEGGNLTPFILEEGEKMNEDKSPECLGGFGKKCNNDTEYHQQNRVYSSDKCAISVVTGFQPSYLVEEKIKIKQATKEGYIEMNNGGVADMSYPNSNTRRGRVQNNGECCPTLTAQNNEICKIDKIGDMFRIRKLTPKECYRLQGVVDEDSDKMLSVNSNSQCYKQAGNSITVDVMVAMFKKLI